VRLLKNAARRGANKIPIFQQMREGFSLSSAPIIRLSAPSAPALLASAVDFIPKIRRNKIKPLLNNSRIPQNFSRGIDRYEIIRCMPKSL